MSPDDLSAAVVLAVWALASYRVTHLLVVDDILGEHPETDDEGERPPYSVKRHPTGQFVRKPNRGTGVRRLIDLAIYGSDRDGCPYPAPRSALARWVGALYSCQWCCGVWLSALVVWSWSWGEPFQWALIVAAVAGAQGFMASRYEG